MADLRTEALLANVNRSFLEGMYGEDSSRWRAAGAATLIGAEIAEGYNTWANATLAAQELEKKQAEIDARTKVSVSLLAQESKKVQAVQETAFAKAGVKLEGSAIDVIAETAMHAMEAAKIRQREADFERGNLEVEKALQKMRAKYAPLNTILDIGTIGLGTAMEARAFEPNAEAAKKSFNRGRL